MTLRRAAILKDANTLPEAVSQRFLCQVQGGDGIREKQIRTLGYCGTSSQPCVRTKLGLPSLFYVFRHQRRIYDTFFGPCEDEKHWTWVHRRHYPHHDLYYQSAIQRDSNLCHGPVQARHRPGGGGPVPARRVRALILQPAGPGLRLQFDDETYSLGVKRPAHYFTSLANCTIDA